jgi:long-chain fatty acid transport protein
MTVHRRSALLFVLVLTVGSALNSEARAGGLYFSDRGVRPLGRGGAFVAGADDLGAVWYNPAGIVDAQSSILVDASWLHFTSDYTNQTQVVDASGTVMVAQSPTTHGTTPFLPIPTIVGGFAFGAHKQFEIALGAFAPYTAVASYPANSAARYSLVSLNGSTLVITGAWAAYKPVEWLRIGAGFEALVGTFSSSVVFNAGPKDRLVSAPEDTSYDVLSQLNVGPIFAPSGNAGVIVAPVKYLRIGVSGQLPFTINANGTLNVRLASSPLFDGASQAGNEASVRFKLPPILRFGVEVRPVPALRVELSYVREFWSVQEDIEITPKNVSLACPANAPCGAALPPQFGVQPIRIPRDFTDSSSVRLGAEYSFTLGGYGADVRVGVSYDQSAIPNAYLTPLTIDLDKITPSIGFSFHVGKSWRFDTVYAHVFGVTTTVGAATAAVQPINPIPGNPAQSAAMNGGTYAARADIVGVGLNYKF